MKILHLNAQKSWRGGEQQVVYLTEELKKFEVESIIGYKQNSALGKYCLDNHIQSIDFSFSNGYDFLSALKLKRIINKLNIDLIHIHCSRSHSIAIWAILLGAKAPMILSRRVEFMKDKNRLTSYKYNHPRIKRIICVSKRVKEILFNKVKETQKLEVIYSGIDLSKFENKVNKNLLHKEYNLSSDARIIANISALAPSKGLHTFVDTVEKFKEINKDDIKFFLIGEGSIKKEIEEYIKIKNLQNDIILTGFRTDIPEIFPELDIFFFTSEKEGLGTSILDAFANKIPVVTTKAGGIPEMVFHQKTGLLYPIKSPKQLAEGLNLILNNPEQAQEMVINAKNLLKEKFNKETTAAATYEVYKQVLKED